jgi:hypothetical protein
VEYYTSIAGSVLVQRLVLGEVELDRTKRYVGAGITLEKYFRAHANGQRSRSEVARSGRPTCYYISRKV